MTAFDPRFDQSFLPVLEAALKEHADRTCLKFQGETYSYSEVDRVSAQIANRLIGDGFEPGMKGAIYSLNAAISFIATVGLIRAGGVWIPVNPRNSAQDNVAVLRQFGCDALFFQKAFTEPVKAFAESSEPLVSMVCLDGDHTVHPTLERWMAGASASAPTVSRAPTDLVTIPLTGGTTGLPKGVMLS